MSSILTRPSLILRSFKNRAAVLLAGLVCGSALPAFAGKPIAPEAPPVAKAPEENPFSFFGGQVVIDMEERFRWEIRENNFDFSDRTEALTDDNWFLNRFRVGLTIKPTRWLRIYAQGQDARRSIPIAPISPTSWARTATTTSISARAMSKSAIRRPSRSP